MATSTSFAPLSVAPISSSSIPVADSPEYSDFLIHYVTQAFELIRSSASWKLGKTFAHGQVQSKSKPSGMEGRLGKLSWHLRQSSHRPTTETDLSYQDFRRGLRIDHTKQEAEYIPSLIQANPIQTIRKGELEIWQTIYKMPILISDRDFVEAVVTLDLPPHSQPFSQDHQNLTIESIRTRSEPSTASTSLLVIQFPVDHPDVAQGLKRVRAKYASVEVVFQHPDTMAVEWIMAVQSDSGGRIPIILQEMAVPGKIAEDVPNFIQWAKQKKSSH